MLVVGVNLLFISPRFCGGTKRYAQGLIECLAALGRCKLVLYVQKGAFHLEGSYPSVTYCEFPAMMSPLQRVLVEQLRLPILVRRAGIDVLYSPGFVPPLLAGCSQVITIHDVFCYRFPTLVRRWQRVYLNVFVRAGVHTAKLVTVVSNTTGNDVASLFPRARRKLLSILPGVPNIVAPPGADCRAEEPIVLFVGYITPIKNIGVLVAAMRVLYDRQIPCKLRVVGSDMFGHLREAIAACKLPSEVVEFSEGVDDPTLARAYHQALCMVMPSRYEGFGLPVLEAMAHGCPVITSGEGALREVAADAALYFAVDSAQSLADAIGALIADGSLREDLRRKGIENCSRFSWEKSAQALMSAIERIGSE